MTSDYTGPAVLTAADGSTVHASVTLRAWYDPIAGGTRYHGRLAADPAITALARRRVRDLTVALPAPYGLSFATRLTDPDPWSRYQIKALAPRR